MCFLPPTLKEIVQVEKMFPVIFIKISRRNLFPVTYSQYTGRGNTCHLHTKIGHGRKVCFLPKHIAHQSVSCQWSDKRYTIIMQDFSHMSMVADQAHRKIHIW